MNHYMEKTVFALGVVLVGASLLTACNAVQGTATGLEDTAVGVGKTVTGTVVGAGKDINAVKQAMVPVRTKALHKAVHHITHHHAHDNAMTKSTVTSAKPTA